MILPPGLEVECGLEVYASQSEPCAGRIKSMPEDFGVEEIMKPGELVGDRLPGYLPLYRVEKQDIDTFHLERELAPLLKSRITHAGVKDRRAKAIQYITPTSSRSKAPTVIEGEKYRLTLEGFVPRPLSRSAVSGNSFRVVIRGCGGEIEERLGVVREMSEARRVPNFFGLQRFGGGDAITHRVGRAS